MWTVKEASPCHKFLSVATHQRGEDWRAGEKGRGGREGGSVQRAEHIQDILDEVGVEGAPG